MSETSIQKFKRLLSELFMFDHADLDFGIYRIMNAKRDEIRRFLDDDLLPQVRQEIEHLDTGRREQLIREREERLQVLRDNLVPDPENTPKIQEIDAQLAQFINVTALENDIFSDLYDFFRRYYSEGDYLALRRYKEGVYAIPYEGEEVKLHWANADQYYIKTSEYFRDYTFKLPDRRRVHFKLTSADTEQNNNKASNGEKRVFILCEEDFITEEDGELVIRFEYRVDPQKRSQSDLTQQAAERILSTSNLQPWMMVLGRPAPSDANPDRTLLHKYLTDYTSRNTFDYFIHKDLGTFLRRELDFFIKNEIMHLDDIERASTLYADSYLAKIKALRRVAKKVIDFLEQLENFQKKLWLKKKFVIETHYCVTLDRIPKELYPEIAANDAQREEWVRLFAIDEINGDLIEKRYSVPLSVEFLQQNQYLLVDTRFFDDDFKYRLLSSFGDLDTAIDGILVNSENFQALNFLRNKYNERIDCIHIDPPYNTDNDEDSSRFLYKNGYQHSSWISMMGDRLAASYPLLNEHGVYFCHIDHNEYEHLALIFRNLPTVDQGTIVWDKRTPAPGSTNIARQNEYIITHSRGKRKLRYLKPNAEAILEKARRLIKNHGGVNETSREAFKSWIQDQSEFSGGEKAYNLIDDDGRVFQSVHLGASEQRTDEKYFIPLIHPVTGKPCPVPARGWTGQPSFLQELLDDNLIVFGEDETTQPRRKYYLEENLAGEMTTVIQSAEKGKPVLDALGLEFPYAHPLKFYSRLNWSGTELSDQSILIDFFAGSGTNGHSVIQLNREDNKKRKYILVEMGSYFDTVLRPRIQKVIYSEEWRDGKPVSRDGISHIFKYMKLESYEDALNNLHWNRTPQQQKLLWGEGKDEFREDYILRYMLDVEAKGSKSLLDMKQFVNPFAYQLEIGTGTVGETHPMTIDLVETFNYLLGLHVRRMQAFDHIRTVEGENRDGQQVLVIWRNQEAIDNEALDAFFLEMGGLEAEFDLIYVNGDNHLENLKQGKEVWQVRLIEPTFHQLMFDVQDV